jgi:ribulose-bisphosphate carboxylase large chain
MTHLSGRALEIVETDLDEREDVIRRLVAERLPEMHRPDLSEHIVGTYFVAARTMQPHQVGGEISYHMTSGVRSAPPGSLLDRCSGRVIDSVTFTASGRIGLVRVAFPLKMLLDDTGALYSTDILHIAAGAGVFALTEHIDIKLVDLAMSAESLRRFPGPAYGAPGVRSATAFEPGEIAFGTILKPCTGITPEEEERLVEQAAGNPMFLFVKEDENFMPRIPFAPLEVRLRRSLDAVRRAADRRGNKGLIFAPHITAPPHLLAETVECAIAAGANGVMFSEYYTGGSVRMVRERTRALSRPPAIYGHNGGIDAKAHHIYREVLDFLARLDGIDFRQTAPVAAGRGLLRPYGLEWRQCESVLSRPLAEHAPVMMARAGGLDQGNLIPNLADATAGTCADNYLFLAGSAINGIKNSRGEYDPSVGAAAMRQAVEVFRQGQIILDPAELKTHAARNGLRELSAALGQRYPENAA